MAVILMLLNQQLIQNSIIISNSINNVYVQTKVKLISSIKTSSNNIKQQYLNDN